MAWLNSSTFSYLLVLVMVASSMTHQCEYVNMEVTSEHGNRNVLTIKTLNKNQEVCDGSAQSSSQQTPSQESSANAFVSPSNNNPLPHRNQAFLPTVSFLFGEFIPECGK